MTRRMFKTRVDVGFFEVGKVLEDLLRRHPAGKHFEHMAYRDSHTANRSVQHRTRSGLIVIGSICMCLFYKNLRRTQSDFNNPFRPRMC
jgi:hypothetical protein